MSAQMTMAGDEFITPAEKKERARNEKARAAAGAKAASTLLKAAQALGRYRTALTRSGVDVQRDHSTPRLIEEMSEFGSYLDRLYGGAA